MNYVDSLENALNYIETHLCEELDLSSIAQSAGYSLYHFQRLFKGAVGDSLKEYIIKRRITEAARELVHTQAPIIDIAIKYGYESREAFSRAFEKVYGKAPSEVRKNGLLYCIRERMTFDYMMFEYNMRKEGLKPFYRKLPQRIVVGRKWKVRNDGTNLQDVPLLWQQWNKNKDFEKIPDIKYPNECMGLCLFSKDDTSFDYMIGCEVTSRKIVPEDMTVHILEPSLYAVFKTLGPITESVQKTWSYIYSFWLPESDYDHAGTTDIEYYYYNQGQLTADLYIPIVS